MEKNNATAGKTAKLKLTKGQQNALIMNTKELSVTQELIDNTSSENLKTFIVFDNGSRIIALTRVSGKEYVDNNGNAVETVYDPQAFDMLNEYFEGSKQVILEEIYAIYQDAEKGGKK